MRTLNGNEESHVNLKDRSESLERLEFVVKQLLERFFLHNASRESLTEISLKSGSAK